MGYATFVGQRGLLQKAIAAAAWDPNSSLPGPFRISRPTGGLGGMDSAY